MRPITAGETKSPRARSRVRVIWTRLWLENAPLDAAARAVLAREELARAARFRAPRDRSRFLQRRAFRRLALAQVLGIPAHAVAIAADAHDAPVVAAEPGIVIGASARGELAAVAWSRGLRFGIDLERPRPLGNPDGLLRHISSEEEILRQRADPGVAACARLYRVWTAKEAVLKALRVGLRREPATLTRVVEGDGAEFVRAAAAAPEIGTWRIHRTRLPRGATLALAVPAEAPGPCLDVRAWGQLASRLAAAGPGAARRR